jgi:hypothetical protein
MASFSVMPSDRWRHDRTAPSFKHVRIQYRRSPGAAWTHGLSRPHHSQVRVLTHIKKLDDCFGQFLVRVSCACGAVREIEPEALGAPCRLVSDSQRARAADALLEVREEGRRSRGSCEAQAKRRPDALAPGKNPERPGGFGELRYPLVVGGE